jgi:hypothetical protein
MIKVIFTVLTSCGTEFKSNRMEFESKEQAHAYMVKLFQLYDVKFPTFLGTRIFNPSQIVSAIFEEIEE